MTKHILMLRVLDVSWTLQLITSHYILMIPVTIVTTFIRNASHTSDELPSSTNLFEVIRRNRKPTDDYDCLIGISGGIDSSWVLHLAVEHGLTFSIAF